jgi:diguanylate cyclase (GGDEF)-like protein
VPLSVRLLPLGHRIKLTVYLTVLLAVLVGATAWSMTQITRGRVESLSQMVDASMRVRHYRTQIDQMQFASYRFIASNHESAVESVARTYEQTRASLKECIAEQCPGNAAVQRMNTLVQHLDAFHSAFEEAVAQRQAIETVRVGRFTELIETLTSMTGQVGAVTDPATSRLLSGFQKNLMNFEHAADTLWREDVISDDLSVEFEQARSALQALGEFDLLADQASAMGALDELSQLYRVLLQRSRGHQFLVGVVMAGDAYEMQKIAELLEDELAERIERTQASVDDRLRAFTIGLLALLLIGSCLVFWVGRSMSASVGRQIRRLSRIFSELAAGSEDPVRFESFHNDEVGELVRAAERFREENVERHALINRYRELNEELESKVAQRTLALTSSNEELERLANTDRLTGVCNRRALDVVLTAELDRARRYESSLSLLFFDLDHFKRVNDLYGHVVGDQVLRDFVSQLRDMLRDSDILGRWGGEEFIVVCPETKAGDIINLAERIRTKIEGFKFAQAGKVTVSIGIAELAADDHIRDLIDRADQALYEAKRSGRNCCVLLN